MSHSWNISDYAKIDYGYKILTKAKNESKHSENKIPPFT